MINHRKNESQPFIGRKESSKVRIIDLSVSEKKKESRVCNKYKQGQGIRNNSENGRNTAFHVFSRTAKKKTVKKINVDLDSFQNFEVAEEGKQAYISNY